MQKVIEKKQKIMEDLMEINKTRGLSDYERDFFSQLSKEINDLTKNLFRSKE